MKKYISYGLLAIIILGLLGLLAFRIDLTKEKRYTLNAASIKVLEDIKSPVKVKVYLEGDFPANFKQLQNETKFLLTQLQDLNPKIDFEFIDPIATKMSQQEMQAMGLQPSMLPHMKDGKMSQIVIFPYAVLQHKGQGTAVPLVLSLGNVPATEQLSKSIEGLEYNFISALKSITQEQRKSVGFLVNQKELGPNYFKSFIDMALENYDVGPAIPQNQTELSPVDIAKFKKFDALVIAKPRAAFTDTEKLVMDQYIMNGGKTLWMVESVNAEMDSLMQAKKLMAYPVDNNLTDLLFNYGVRLNTALVKDMKQAATLRTSVGEVQGNPQFVNLLWPYFGLGLPKENAHVISKNISPVKYEFPTAIDTLSRPQTKFTVLHQSSSRSSLKTVPNYVQLSEMANLDSLSMMEKPSTPKIYSVLLEGQFKSAYADRVEAKQLPNFVAKSKANKMIVMSDGDVAKNSFVQGQAAPLGYDMLTGQQYGNQQFLQNCLDYLLDDSQLMSIRDRNIALRPLDKKRLQDEQADWQWFNLIYPLLGIALLAFLGIWYKQKTFGKSR
jgi:ABC-2 type transport system permease protein